MQIYLALDDEAFDERLTSQLQSCEKTDFTDLRIWLLQLARVDGYFALHERRTIKELLRRLGLPTEARITVAAPDRKPLRRSRSPDGPQECLEALLRRRYPLPPASALVLALTVGVAGWAAGYIGQIWADPWIPAMATFVSIFVGGSLRGAAIWAFLRHYFVPGRRAVPESLHMLEIYGLAFVLAVVMPPTANLPLHWATPVVLMALAALAPALHGRLHRLASVDTPKPGVACARALWLLCKKSAQRK